MSMTLEKAIIHAEAVAKTKEREAKENRNHGGWAYDDEAKKCSACAAEHRQLTEWLKELKERREQDVSDTNTGDMISRQAVRYKLDALVNEFEEILAHIREREVNDSVCGLCEYDGAYIGQSGDWCNECPGFEKDDCFKLKEKCRKEWTDING